MGPLPFLSQISVGLHGDTTHSLLPRLLMLLINLSFAAKPTVPSSKALMEKNKTNLAYCQNEPQRVDYSLILLQKGMFVGARDPGSCDRLCRLFPASILTLIWKVPCGKRKMTGDLTSFSA